MAVLFIPRFCLKKQRACKPVRDLHRSGSGAEGRFPDGTTAQVMASRQRMEHLEAQQMSAVNADTRRQCSLADQHGTC